MSRRALQLQEDRALRDAARALVKHDIAHLRGDVQEKGIFARILSSAALGTADIVDEGMELVERHKPASYGVGAILAMIVGWWALGGDGSGNSDDEDYAWDETD